MKFEKQTYTQVPNSLFLAMQDMDECELKVVMLICRYTFGYHREEVKLSTRRIADEIGMNTASVQKGADAAVERGLIEKIIDGNKTTTWRAIVDDSESDTRVIQNLTRGDSENESLSSIKETINKNEISFPISENHQKKGDILDGILDLTFKPKAVREAFAQFFRLTPNWDAKYNRQFLEWAVDIGMTPEQVQRAAEVWRSDKRFNWSVPTLKGVQEHWFELIETQKEEVKEYTRLL